MRSYLWSGVLAFLLIFIGPGWAAEAEPEPVTGSKAVIETSLGDITLLLDVEKAPISAANFLSYADQGFYDETIFHRVVVGFVVQGGGYDAELIERESDLTIHNEADNGLRNLRGTISMARNEGIDSASNQFFINTADNVSLDHTESSCTRTQQDAALKARERGMLKPRTCTTFGYAVFGKVVNGMDVVDAIELVDTNSVDGFDDLPVEPVVIRSISRQ
jgi:cyclophilin family peptidyl-prolyl cis-trans isomerase